MSVEYDFDVIIVGGGVAGTVCAYLLAKEGHEVLLIERGSEVGAKNLSGGVFYCQVMNQIFPDFIEKAPLERKITKNILSFLNPKSAVNLEYWDQRLAEPVNAVSVLRAKLDPWLAEQAEEAGATIMPGMKVDELVREDGKFCGVRAGEDTVYGKVIVAADGVNSFLAQYAGIRPQEPLSHLGVGVKSVIHLGEETVKERFNLQEGEGAAYQMVGDCTQGVAGGGFLYTNRDSVSVGIVAMLDDLKKKQLPSSDLHDHFLKHPFIEPFLRGGKLIEYGCHLVAEGGKTMQHGLVHDGLVLIGDAAGFTLNTGFTIRGMDLAAGSAQAAANAIDTALRAENFSASSLSKYLENYQTSFVGKDTETFARAPQFLHNQELYGQLGELAADTLHGIYNLDTTPRQRLLPVVRAALKKSPLSMRRLVKLGLQAVRSI
ncbi:FAD-dependent oxidoreductase [Varibaculum massiliense]|uniref:FAD-dependent oxidoreductase n=1 Tax=Varibaculum massiliense TaxID=1852372 RepID=UPI0008D93EBE|nr:FAD-dependent oxidoreductase [Varibaculum massiliense]